MKTEMKMFDLWDVADSCHIFVKKESDDLSELVLDGRNGPLIKYDVDISDCIVKHVSPEWLPNYGMVLKVILKD